MFIVRGRKSWGARAPKNTTTQPRSSVHTLVVHHTAGSAPSKIADVKRELQSIQRQHMVTQGWSDIGYNFLIDRAGRVWEGRGYDRVGAHTLNHNTGTLGVSFMGNYDLPDMRLNKRQLAAYAALKARLRAKGFRITTIKGHRQMPDQATACPGRNIMKQLKL